METVISALQEKDESGTKLKLTNEELAEIAEKIRKEL